MHTHDDKMQRKQTDFFGQETELHAVASAGLALAAHAPCFSISSAAVSGVNHLTD